MTTITRARTSTAVLLIAAFALLMSGVLLRALAFHQPATAAADWGPSRWIGLDDTREKLYLRRELTLGSAPRTAYLTVAGSDAFDLYVNGTLVGREEFLGERPGSRYDLTRLLQPGSNLIALEVTRSSVQRPAQARALLVWQEGAGAPKQLGSDASWRATSRRQLAAMGEIDWTDPAYAATDWPQARVVDDAEGGELLQPAALPQAMISPPVRIHRLWHGDRGAPVGAFARTLTLDADAVRGAWLGVSASGVHTLAVNGTVLGPTPGAAQRMDVYDIAPYLRRGDNRVEVQVSGARAPATVALAGRVETAEGIVDFSGDERWTDAPSGLPLVTLVAEDANRPAMTMALTRAPLSWRLSVLGGWLLAAAVLGGALAAVAAWAAAQTEPATRALAWMRHARPWAMAALLLTGGLLATLDPRIALDAAYAYALAAAAVLLAAAVYLWQGTVERPRPARA